MKTFPSAYSCISYAEAGSSPPFRTNHTKIYKDIALSMWSLILIALIGLYSQRIAVAESPPYSQLFSTPHFDGAHSFSILPKDRRLANFTLLTAWIPGDDHKGYLQYQVTTTAYAASSDEMKSVPPSQDEQISDYLKKMLACTFHLRLSRIFASKDLSLTFTGDVNWTNSFESLTANEVVQMDEARYRSFLKDRAHSDWKIISSCQ